MAAGGKPVEITGLVDLVRQLKGPLFRDVNAALRPMARGIADELAPHVALMVALSAAPQAEAMSKTVRTKADRVPVIVIGRVNPRFRSGFARRGSDSKLRRGSLAHGVIYGPKGGKRSTATHENYYRIPRDDSGGAFGRSVKTGRVFDLACEEYLKGFLAIMTHYGFAMDGTAGVHWKGAD
jgi:hypothetical protein